jgi:predicted Zn-ribbon and HTH transcriptional regulator
MNRIPVALFNSTTEAEPVQQRLAQAGIESLLQEEMWSQKFWFVSKRAAGVRLEVSERDFERAEQLLCGWDTPEGVLRQAIHCPECKSLLVDYPQFARHSVFANIAVGLLAEVGLVERDYYCEHCHYTWPKEHTNRVRAHMAPYYFIEDVENKASLPRSGPK